MSPRPVEIVQDVHLLVEREVMDHGEKSFAQLVIVPIAKLLDYRRVYLSELPKDSKDRKSVFAGSCVLSHNFWVSNVSNYFRRALPRSLGFVYHRCILNTYERLLFKMCI